MKIITEKIDVKGLSFKELEKIIIRERFPTYRARQIFHWLYQKKVISFNKMTNLPLELIARLELLFWLKSIDCVKENDSRDGSKKFLFRLNDNHFIESVLIKDKNRNTACLSTQVGCLRNCLFCASGREGFKRNLQAGEIVEQLIAIERISNGHVNNIVFMGMGEPFDNYEQLIKSIDIINEKWGINIGARKMTISSCGIIPGIERITENPLQVELSISLHAAEEDVRTMLMPVNKKYPLAKLIPACKNYVKKKNRQITFEYIMLKGINDSQEQAKKLCYLISNFQSKAKVNLIIYNPNYRQKGLYPSGKDVVISFQQILKREHIPVTIRYSRGQDIEAACGQLKCTYLNH